MYGPDTYRMALAILQLPAEWQLDVEIRPRRRNVTIEVKPRGAVAILIPPTATPELVVQFVRSRRRWITGNVDRAARLAPDHVIKKFVDGEEFDLLGQHYRLQLVDARPTSVERLSAGTADHVLFARRQRPGAGSSGDHRAVPTSRARLGDV